LREAAGAAFLIARIGTAAPADAPAEDVREVLLRQTQELMDATGSGTAGVWDRYLDPDVRYTDENGAVLSKKEILAQTKPLPPGVTGTIRVTGFEVALHGDVAVATHVEDEHENYHGHDLHCRYRTTDTWMRKPEGWRLVAAQVLAIREDPPAISLPEARRREYCGRYSLTPEIAYEIRCKAGAFEGQQTGRPAEELRAEAPDVLFVPGKPRYRFVFLRGPDGRIQGLAQRREAWDLVWNRER